MWFQKKSGSEAPVIRLGQYLGENGYALPAQMTREESSIVAKELESAVHRFAATRNSGGAAQALGFKTMPIDASALVQFDSSALAALLACLRALGFYKQGLAIKNAPERLQALAALYGVEELLFTPAE
jgi:phospholipid transport system transporter-binding protein